MMIHSAKEVRQEKDRGLSGCTKIEKKGGGRGLWGGVISSIGGSS